jgi:5-methylcytosine-specific restriction endonuclease McrA
VAVKICNQCNRELPTTSFVKNNQQKDGLTGKCRNCLSIVRKAWNQKYNKTGKAKATARRYYHSAKGQKIKKAYRATYLVTEEQREQYRIAARKHEKEDRYKARTRRYWQSEKGKVAKAVKDKKYQKTEKGIYAKQKVAIKRKYQIKTSDCTLTLAQWQEIKEQYGNACAYCRKPLARLEKDHVIPLSKGGKHTKANVVPACRTCNAQKGNRLLASKEASGI